jgi:hypothetical protein
MSGIRPIGRPRPTRWRALVRPLVPTDDRPACGLLPVTAGYPGFMRPGRYLIPVAAVLAVASCADAREGLVAQAASSFSQRIAAGNFAAACALLAPATRERVERAGRVPSC